ncbi:MAG: hypothetical protein KAT62_00045 [Desulfuromonadales bacterium]|nr:hypothetical protein [Desulfuromonadales bacterium]
MDRQQADNGPGDMQDQNNPHEPEGGDFLTQDKVADDDPETEGEEAAGQSRLNFRTAEQGIAGLERLKPRKTAVMTLGLLRNFMQDSLPL